MSEHLTVFDAANSDEQDDGRVHTRRPQSGVQCCGGRLTERKCMLTIMGLLVALLVLAFGLFISERVKSQNTDARHPGTCQSATCIQLSAAFMTSMDTTADPCQDFHQYACGGWNVANPIPDDKSRWSTFNLLAENNLRVIKNLLELPTAPSNKATMLYHSCMNESAINALGAAPVQPLLASVNWNPTDDAAWSAADLTALTNAVASLHKMEVFPLFSMLIYADDKNSTANVGHIGQSGLGLPDRGYYIGVDRATDAKLVAYQTYLRTVFAQAGVTLTEPRLQQMLDLETQLAEVNVPKADLRDPEATYNKMAVSGLSVMAPSVDWTAYFAALFPDPTFSADQRAAFPMIVSTPKYMSNMSAIIAATNKQVVVTYLQAQLLLSAAPHLSSPFVDASFAFNKVMTGVQVMPPRWKTCLGRVDGALGFMLGKMFVDAKFPVAARASANQMIANIKAAFKAGLPLLSWMDDATRTAASGKADAVVQKIGYPEFMDTAAGLEAYYAKLNLVDANQYWANSLAVRKYEMQQNYDDVKIPVDKSRWDMTPPTVNAYYNPSNNEIAFPAGILQPPFFEKGFPMSVNYGAIGVVVGHEITHGFDDQGSQFDKFGNLVPWWPAKVTEDFKTATKCIADQYSNYTVNGEHVNGVLTLGENIADNGGLKESYKAFKAWQAQNGMEQTLPALSLTHEQLFFLSFAQPWCGAARPAEAHRLLLVDPHSPAKFRVIGTLSNSAEFAAAYNCPAGSPMNPVKKCTVW